MSGFSDASIAVDEARRYSRMIGFSACDSVYGTPGQCSSISSPTRCSCDGLTIDQSRQTAIASTPSPRACAIASTTVSSSRARNGSPSASMRSRISNVSQRGTYGMGYGSCLNGSGLPPSRISRMSGKPCVVKNAVRAVLPSTIAFVARVVPYVSTSVCASSSPTESPRRSATWPTPSRSPS